MLGISKGSVGLLITLFPFLLVACTNSSTDETSWIGPGDKIGSMTVEQELSNTAYASIWDFCEHIMEKQKPETRVVDCIVPHEPAFAFNFGWSAVKSSIESNWNAMTFEMYIDDQRVDLDQFDWEEIDNTVYGYQRYWEVYLVDPTPGDHSFRYLWSSEEAINDGWDLYTPGVYEQVVNFTVSE